MATPHEETAPDMLRAALDYAQRGIPVFPVHRPYPGRTGITACSCHRHGCSDVGKHPHYQKGTLEHGVKDATTDPKKITAWWKIWPDANIGVPTQFLHVFDGDGAEGVTEMRAGPSVLCPVVSTGGGGEHWWFLAPEDGTPIKSKEKGQRGWPYEHCDFKANGGYVIAPPSLHKSGARYTWRVSLDECAVPPLPDFLLDALGVRDSATDQEDEPEPEPIEFGAYKPDRLVAQAIGKVENGESRNNTGIWLACQLRDARLTQDDAREYMRTYWQEVQFSGAHEYAWAEAEKTLSSAYSRGPREQAKPPKGSGTEHKAPKVPSEGVIVWGTALYVQAYKDTMRYVAAYDRWYIWNGRYWKPDTTKKHLMRGVLLVRRLYKAAASEADSDKRVSLMKKVARLDTGSNIKYIVAFAGAERGIAAEPDTFDANPLLLNVLNGTLELDTQTGRVTLREHRQSDMLTKIYPAEYHKGAVHPLFTQFLRRFWPEHERRSFLQEASGYSLTGLPKRNGFELVGPTHSGKSQTIRMLVRHSGDYAGPLKASSLAIDTRAGGDKARGDLSGVADKRLIGITEVRKDMRFDEELIKTMLSGGDMTKVRDLYERGGGRSVTWGCTLWLSGNHPYGPDSGDDAVWGRLHVIRCEHQVPEEDRNDDIMERTEDPEVTGDAMLAWRVKGFERLYREKRGRLTAPDAVTRATRETRDQTDPWTNALEALVEITGDKDDGVKKSELWFWAKSFREGELTDRMRWTIRHHNELEDAVTRRGGRLVRARTRFNNGEYWQGVRWKQPGEGMTTPDW